MPDDGRRDLVVAGGGPGGYTAAFYAADLGMRVTLIDHEAHPGGVCLYRGCIPSKALLHAVKILRDAEEASGIGIRFGPPEIDPDALCAWKDGVVQK
ncbi:MAG TPA: FAD-dependent oxidoreductase, partial [bacterium]|nr:FAD-dependent oxidoreductase [bacterium]